MGFISREGAARNYFCHVFKAENEKMVGSAWPAVILSLVLQNSESLKRCTSTYLCMYDWHTNVVTSC